MPTPAQLNELATAVAAAPAKCDHCGKPFDEENIPEASIWAFDQVANKPAPYLFCNSDCRREWAEANPANFATWNGDGSGKEYH